MAISLGGFSGGGGGAGAITSVNGQTGIVVLTGDNIESNHTAVNYTPTSSTIAGHLSGIDTQLGTLVGGLTYKGTFNATTGLTNTGGNLNNSIQGDLYIIDTAGTIYGKTWAIGDHLLINENMGGSIVNSRIDKIDNTEPNALIATNNLSDLDNAATARTNLGLAIGTDVQAYDAQLADVAGLATTDGGFIVGNGSNFVLESGATARTSLGLAIGTDVQAHDAQLDDIAGLATTDSGFIVGNGSNFVLESGATARTSLGLGSAATSATTDFLASTAGLNDLSDVSYTGGAGIDNYVLTYDHSTTSWGAEPSAGGGGSLQAANNLSDLDNAATARTNLGVAIGTDVQAYDAQLADVAGLATTDGGFIVGDGSNFVLESGSTARTSLGLAIGTDVQAYDAQLDDIAGLATTDSGFIVGDGSNFVLETGATARTSLGLGSAAQAATTDFLASTAGLNDLSDVTITAAASGEYLRYSGAAWVDASLGIVDDTTPSLGGDLDTNDNEIVTASNRNVILRPNGTGVVQLGGNTNPAELRLYCESSDVHYVGLKSPTHAQLSGSVTWRLPTADASTSGDALVSDGAGNLSFTTISGGGGTAPNVTTHTISTNTTISTTTGIEEVHLINNGGAAVVITLPAASTSGAGYKYQIKRLGTANVTISAAIDAGSSFVLATQYDSLTVVSNGTQYYII